MRIHKRQSTVACLSSCGYTKAFVGKDNSQTLLTLYRSYATRNVNNSKVSYQSKGQYKQQRSSEKGSKTEYLYGVRPVEAALSAALGLSDITNDIANLAKYVRVSSSSKRKDQEGEAEEGSHLQWGRRKE